VPTHAHNLAALASAQLLNETVIAMNITTIPLTGAEQLDGKLVVTAFRATETSGWCDVCWSCQRTARV
jgi:hypothetical protein